MKSLYAEVSVDLCHCSRPQLIIRNFDTFKTIAVHFLLFPKCEISFTVTILKTCFVIWRRFCHCKDGPYIIQDHSSKKLFTWFRKNSTNTVPNQIAIILSKTSRFRNRSASICHMHFEWYINLDVYCFSAQLSTIDILNKLSLGSDACAVQLCTKTKQACGDACKSLKMLRIDQPLYFIAEIYTSNRRRSVL